MHLCCGRPTNHKNSKKSKEITRISTGDNIDSPAAYAHHNNSGTYGEVKRSSVKGKREESDHLSTPPSQSLAFELNSRSTPPSDDQTSTSSALRNGGALSTFGKVVPREVQSKKEELMESPDYDNTRNFVNGNMISPDVGSLSGVESASVESGGEKGSQGESYISQKTFDMNSNYPAQTKSNLLHSPSIKSYEANMDLDSVLAMMKSMVSSEDDKSTLKRTENGEVRVKTFCSDSPHLTSVQPNGVPPQSNHFVTDDEKTHSTFTPFRLNSPFELPSQDSATAAVVASAAADDDERLEAAKTTAKDNNGSDAIALDHYYIQGNTKYSDSNSMSESQGRPNLASSPPSAKDFGHVKTDPRTTQEGTTRITNAADDTICTNSSQPNSFTPETEEYPSLTSSQGNVVSDSSSTSLSGDGGGGSSNPPSHALQFKALRLEVLKATSKLLDFVGEIWRRKESLHGKLPRINLLCLHLKTGLHELENFGLGLVSHLPAEEQQTMEKKLLSQLKLLQNIRNGINRYLEGLERDTLSEPSGQWSDETLKVKVGNIILLTKVIPGLVRTFGSFVDDVAKVDLSKKSVVISEADHLHGVDKTPSPDKPPPPPPPPPADDSGPIPPDLNSQGRDLNQCESDLRTDHVEESPPAIPPKLFRSAKTTCQVIHEDNSREERSCHSDNESLSSNDVSAVRQVICGERKSSVDACDPQQLRIDVCRPSSSPSVAITPLEVNESSGHRHPPPVVFRRKSLTSSSSGAEEALQNTTSDSNGGGVEENRFSPSDLVTPDFRASGISLTVQMKLEELQRQATSQSVLLHTDDDCGFTDYDLPAGIMEENLPNLCESDRKLLLYYSDEMFNHWKVLDSAASAFFQCMEKAQLPKVFIVHSRFVIVAGHKMAYIGDVLARNVADDEARDWLLAYSNDLCERLKQAVRTTKGAALAFPAVKQLQLMVDAIKEVTDSAYELRELLFRLAYLGRAEQPFVW